MFAVMVEELNGCPKQRVVDRLEKLEVSKSTLKKGGGEGTW